MTPFVSALKRSSRRGTFGGFVNWSADQCINARSDPASFRETLCAPLQSLEFATGAEEGIALLRDAGVAVGIASTTWTFGVAVLAERLRVGVYRGTDLLADGEIRYFRPEHKAAWLIERAEEFGISLADVAAVGDSPEPPPSERDALHRPLGDIAEIASEILAARSATASVLPAHAASV